MLSSSRLIPDKVGLRNREKQRENVKLDCEIFRKKMMLQDNSLFQSSIKLSNASRCSSSSYHQQCHNGRSRES